MKTSFYLAVAAVLMSAPAFAADEPATTSAFPAPQAGVDTNAPLAGENSFTEDQARTRITDAGFTNVTNLKLDDNGIWHASATQGSTNHVVAVDYRGNVVVLK